MLAKIPRKRGRTILVPAKRTVRQCLLALGITDEEMRYRKGCRSILENWTGEADVLLELVHRKWKQLAIKHHEANGGDVEQWSAVNSIYSHIEPKIQAAIQRFNNPELAEFECIICSQPFTKKVTCSNVLRSKICLDPKCRREYYRRMARKYKMIRRQTLTRLCAWARCGQTFVTTDQRKQYCSCRCRMLACAQAWKLANPERFAILQKRRDWRTRMARLSPEALEAFRERVKERRAARLANETPEQREARLVKVRQYRAQRIASGWREPKKIPRQLWLDMKRVELDNKLWLYQALVLKHRPQRARLEGITV